MSFRTAGTTRRSARSVAGRSSAWRKGRCGGGTRQAEARGGGRVPAVAEVPVGPLRIIERFGPHLSSMTGVRLSTSVEPERLVKTHCCFCGQQCGIQLKVRDNEVIGFEPWEDFPFNRGMLCPKGVKRYLQGSHPDRLTTALRRDTSSASGFSSLPYAEAIDRVASEIGRIQETHGAGAIGVLGGASLTTEKTYLLGKFARVCLKTPFIAHQRPLR